MTPAARLRLAAMLTWALRAAQYPCPAEDEWERREARLAAQPRSAPKRPLRFLSTALATMLDAPLRSR